MTKKLSRLHASFKLLEDTFRELDVLSFDFVSNCCGLGNVFVKEFELCGTRELGFAVSHDAAGSPKNRPVLMPLPTRKLISYYVSVVDSREGVPLEKNDVVYERGVAVAIWYWPRT